MGAHPRGTSVVTFNRTRISLQELVEKHPNEILGKATAEKFSNRFPYLFKVLAASKPLSIQAHPNLFQARRGFNIEKEQGIALEAYNRNYKDENHKPECICALTDFWALNGFRNLSEIIKYMNKILPDELNNMLKRDEGHAVANGLKIFFRNIMSLKNSVKGRILDAALRYAAASDQEDIVSQWMLKLQDEYPGDIGVLSPIFLNLVCLKPGEAMFLEAGELHAYLEGVGIELMANSDNVLRGGLTPKHIDVAELMNILNFKEKQIAILKPVEIRPCEQTYTTSAEEFALSVIRVGDGDIYSSPLIRSAEILLCTQGEGIVESLEAAAPLNIQAGVSILVPASVKYYNISGKLALYKASVPVSVFNCNF